jgi:hypothetical protein
MENTEDIIVDDIVETVVETNKNPTLLDLEITESFRLERFEITAIRLIPHVSANIDITIFADNRKQYDRTFSLTGQDYLDYQTDDYLYDWVRKNIETIFTI